MSHLSEQVVVVKYSNAVNVAIGRAVADLALEGKSVDRGSLLSKLEHYINGSDGKEKTTYILAAEVVRDSKHVFSEGPLA